MELLAPAGDWDSLLAAVNNGADAVYLGGSRFSARAYAANFERDRLEEAVEFAHLRGVKIYVTVNTLIKDAEMAEALDFLHFLHQIGVDAVIIQDVGLLELVRRYLPGLPLHASTQMTVHNPAGALYLAAKGIRRIVLARELTLEEIKEIKAKSGVEVEVFVHGALCICYSGQCLLSSLIGARSGNRGRCAQPCRLEYRLLAGGKEVKVEAGRHLLSPADLMALPLLPRLQAAGVDALKIEGRMKSPEYVATVTRVYRRALDRLAAGQFTYSREDVLELARIFSRGFTSGYLEGNQGRDMMSYTRPNNRGVYLGRVRRRRRRRKGFLALLELEDRLAPGDEIVYWVRGGRETVTVREIVDKEGAALPEAAAGMEVWVTAPAGVAEDDRVFKVTDVRQLEEVRRTFAVPRFFRRTPVAVRAEGKEGKPLRLTFFHPDGYQAAAATPSRLEPARTRPLTEEFLRKQLDRLGNTPFALGRFDYAVQGEVAVPVKEINEARRNAVAELERKIVASFHRPPVPVRGEEFFRRVLVEDVLPPRQKTGRPRLAVNVSSAEQAVAAAEGGADRVYLGGGFSSQHLPAAAGWEEVARLCRERGVEFFAGTPRIAHAGEFSAWQEFLRELAGRGVIDGYLLAGLGWLRVYRDLPPLPAVVDYPLNSFNTPAVRAFLKEGFEGVTLSVELNREEVAGIHRHTDPSRLEVVVQGALPLMVSAYCAPGALVGERRAGRQCSAPCRREEFALRDRLGVVFPLRCDRYCRMHIFNSVDLCLLDCLDDFAALRTGTVRIEGHLYPPQVLRELVSLYREVLDGKKDNLPGEDLVATVKKITGRDVTRGHYFRGVE
ncbi:MAG: family peptidase [Eubacteriales bacterium]|nr:family peptidase [Eubacteriales bacterium]